MKLEDQVCSVELAKRLQELGVTKEGLFCWRLWLPTKGSSYIKNTWRLSLYKGSMNEYVIITTFTVAELGEMLPVYVTHEQKRDCYEIRPCVSDEEYGYDENNEPTILQRPRMYRIGYQSLRSQKLLNNYVTEDTNEANARAKMLIYLIENQLMELPT